MFVRVSACDNLRVSINMPIYEYQCEACDHELEALQKLSDPVMVDCPECSKPALKKKISAVGFRLKGGGWYETDFKTGNKKNLSSSGDAGGSANNSSAGNTAANNTAAGNTPAVKSAGKSSSAASD